MQAPTTHDERGLEIRNGIGARIIRGRRMKTLIYRIQDKDGRGPYKPGMSAQWADKDRDESTRQPFYYEFGMDVIKKAIYGQSIGCGFRTIKQLRAWFSDSERAMLRSLGYNIVTLEADNILGESSNQLVFACNSPLATAARPLKVLRIVPHEFPAQ
jgi:hypothetical protein